MAAFLVMLREGVEAALVVAILLAYLNRLGVKSHIRWVWIGTISAAFLSLIVGVVIYNTVGGLEGRAEELTEGIIAFAAAALLTWMIFWMGKNARQLRGKLEAEAASAVEVGGVGALAAVAFVAVMREGLESALFMISTTVGETASGREVLGGTLGLLAAIGVGYLVYRGGSRINLRLFFRVTGFLIILFAAGLVSKGVHEFQEVGVLPIIIEPLYEVPFGDPDISTVARFAKTMFGWSPSPSLLMVISYWAYLVPIGAAFSQMTSAGSAAKARVPVDQTSD
ncbi:MAG: iron transporter [Acidimicrobiia bacterium]|nr:iron transporter [Acidimicrobiia bacterium]